MLLLIDHSAIPRFQQPAPQTMKNNTLYFLICTTSAFSQQRLVLATSPIVAASSSLAPAKNTVGRIRVISPILRKGRMRTTLRSTGRIPSASSFPNINGASKPFSRDQNMTLITKKALVELRGGGRGGGGAIPIVSSIVTTISNVAGWVGKSSARCWTALMISIALEICATTLTKVASDTKDPSKLVGSMSLYVASLLGFATCLPKIDVGVAYAVWSALGTAVVSTVGMIFFNEDSSLKKIASIALILLGVIGLNLCDGH